MVASPTATSRARSALELMTGEAPAGMPVRDNTKPLELADERLAMVEFVSEAAKSKDALHKARKKSPDAVLPDAVEQSRLDELFAQIRSAVSRLDDAGERLAAFDREVTQAKEAVSSGHVIAKPDLDLPERQLVWAAALLARDANGSMKKGFYRDNVVQAVSNSRFVDQMAMDFALQAGVTDEGARAKLVMGPPGSWFYHNSSRHIINLDLVHSLILGGVRDPQSGLISTNVDAVFTHEDGHNRLSREWPKTLQKLYSDMAVLQIKGFNGDAVPPGARDTPEIIEARARRARGEDPEGLEPEEYKKLLMLSERFAMLKGLWNAAEDNCVNMFAKWNSQAERGGTRRTDLADGINVVSTIVTRRGKSVLEHMQGKGAEPPASASEAFDQFGHFVNMSFFVDNHLAPDTKDGWKSLGVDLDWLEGEARSQHTSVEDLRKVCAAIAIAQPSLVHMNYPKGSLPAITIPSLTGGGDRQLSEKTLMPSSELALSYNRVRNEMIEEIFAFAAPMLERAMQEKEKAIDEKIAQQQQEGEQAQKPGGESQQGGQGAGQGGGQGSPGGEPDEGQSAGGVRVKGMKKNAAAPDMPGDDPQGEREKEQKKNVGGDKGEQEQDEAAKEARSVGEKRDDKMNGRKAGQGQPKPGEEKAPGGKEKPLSAGGKMGQEANAKPGSSQSARDTLNLGDGAKVSTVAASMQFQEAVREITRSLQRMARETVQMETVVNPNPQRLPHFTGNKMLHGPAFRQFLRDQAAGRPSASNELFNGASLRAVPTRGDIVIMIDGSGSMDGRPLEIAMKTAELVRQSAQKSGYRVFITMWGDNKDWSKLDPEKNPYLVAEPGMDDAQVQKRMETVLDGLSSGTQLAPGFPNVLERIAVAPTERGTLQGRTHFLVISDCGIADADASRRNIETVLNALPDSTLDVILPPRSGRELLNVIDSLELKGNVPLPRVTRLDKEEDITSQMIEMFEHRAGSLPKTRARSHNSHRGRIAALAEETETGRQ